MGGQVWEELHLNSFLALLCFCTLHFLALLNNSSLSLHRAATLHWTEHIFVIVQFLLAEKKEKRGRPRFRLSASCGLAWLVGWLVAWLLAWLATKLNTRQHCFRTHQRNLRNIIIIIISTNASFAIYHTNISLKTWSMVCGDWFCEDWLKPSFVR